MPALITGARHMRLKKLVATTFMTLGVAASEHSAHADERVVDSGRFQTTIHSDTGPVGWATPNTRLRVTRCYP